MPFKNAAKPHEVAMLARVLTAHCARYGIRSAEGRDSVALSLFTHFQRGVIDEDQLAEIIEKEDHPDQTSWSPPGRS